MYDRYGRILVDNHPENAITYTKMQTTTTEEMLDIAKKLAQLIEQPTKRVTLRDKQDFGYYKITMLPMKKSPRQKRIKSEHKKILQQAKSMQKLINWYANV